jgi:Dolichol phosphate-mannose biosynthesis regulatory protein (DPM2)
MRVQVEYIQSSTRLRLAFPSAMVSWTLKLLVTRIKYQGLQGLSDKALGGLMLLAAAVVFVYYTVWALFLVSVLDRTLKDTH